MRGFNPLKAFKNLGVLTTPFGAPTKQETFHGGIDIANKIGTPIPSPVAGVIIKTDDGHIPQENNYGNTVELKDAQGNTHQFHHLQNINVKPGQRVQAGQPVATMGNTGATYSSSGKGDGTNLDFRIISAYGRYLNPMTYLKNMDNTNKFDGQGGPGTGNTEIIFVRHGTTELNGKEKIRGWRNLPLNKEGLAEAEKLGKQMKGTKIHAILSSDLLRAAQTAEIISKHTGAPIVEIIEGLRPWNVGDATGQDTEKMFPVLKEYSKMSPHKPVPGGESFNTFKKRFFDKLTEIFKTYKGKTIVLVAHHRNDRLLAGWEKKGMPKDMSIDIPTFLEKGIEPGTARLIK